MIVGLSWIKVWSCRKMVRPAERCHEEACDQQDRGDAPSRDLAINDGRQCHGDEDAGGDVDSVVFGGGHPLAGCCRRARKRRSGRGRSAADFGRGGALGKGCSCSPIRWRAPLSKYGGRARAPPSKSRAHYLAPAACTAYRSVTECRSGGAIRMRFLHSQFSHSRRRWGRQRHDTAPAAAAAIAE